MELGPVPIKTPLANFEPPENSTETQGEQVTNLGDDHQVSPRATFSGCETKKRRQGHNYPGVVNTQKIQSGRKTEMPGGLNKLYECWFCEQAFTGFHYMVNHMKRFHAGQFVECRYDGRCCKIFLTDEEKMEHVRSEHRPRKSCKFCQRLYDPKCFFSHMKRYHENDNLVRCSYHYCGTYFRSEEEKRKHEQRIHPLEDNKHKCIFCDMIFLNSSMRQHVKSIHSVQMQSAFSCTSSCGRYFFTKLERDEHVASVHKRAALVRTEVECIYCNKNVCTRALHTHIKNCHSDVRIRCGILGCSQQYFHTRTQLDAHFEQVHRIEEEEKKFQCSKCAFKSADKLQLKKHIGKMHADGNIPCPKCAKYFGSLLALKYHLSFAHANLKPCKHCNGKYVHLRQHQTQTKCKKCLQVLMCKQSAYLHKNMCV